MVSDDSGDIEAFYPGANYGDGREEEEEESPTSEGEAEGSSMGMDGDDSQDPGDPHFAGLRGGLWSRGVAAMLPANVAPTSIVPPRRRRG